MMASRLRGPMAACLLICGCRSEVAGWVLAERAAEAQPDATPGDASCRGCPGIVILNGQSPTPEYGQPTSFFFQDLCPEHEAVIGFQGSTVDAGILLVGSLRTLCG